MFIDHIAIETIDLEKMKNFYASSFSCNVSSKYSNPAKGFSSYFLNFKHGARIELIHIESGFTNIEKRKNHIAFTCRNQEEVDQLTDKFREKGTEIKSAARKTGDGYYESVIVDPEGNEIELVALRIFIEPVNEDDLPKILDLQKHCYIEEAELYGDYSILPLQQTLASIKEDFGTQLFLKAIYNGQIVGSVRGNLNNKNAYIGRLIVDPDFRNMGIAKQLIAAIEAKFPHVACYELFTGAKTERNIRLYQKLGYCIKGEKQVSEKLSLIFLEKKNI